ncbi:MAG: putative transport system permease protein [Acidobacteriota bacterium]|nr:putative transport system permease protein [Acidobacteriota bacterium]
MNTLLHDVRYAARILAKNPGFTLVAVLTLALGIGTSTAIFSAVNPVLFEPLPYPHADRLAVISEMNTDGSRNPGTFGMYRGLSERNHSFEAVAVFKAWQPTMTGTDEAERFDGQRVSAGYFRALGAAPALGRDFQASDDQLGGPDVVIISDGLWRRRFGGDSKIIGRQVTLDDKPYTVVGVMPDGFENVLASSADLWSPLQYDLSLGSAWGHHLHTVGRLRAGVSLAQATQEIDALGQTVLREQHPETYGPNVRFVASSLQGEITGAVKPALVAVLAAVALLLLIACVNVTNLLLARASRRRGEFAVRAALGAGRARLVRQMLTESLLLSLAGGAVGLLVATFGVDALRALSPAELPRAGAISVDGAVFVFALGVTTLVGLAVGLIPAMHASRGALSVELEQSSRRSSGGHQMTRRVLVVAEVSLALVLLVGAGLLWRSLERLFAISPGFDSSHLLTMQVHTAGRRFDKETNDQFFAQALEAVRQVPGVTSAAFTSQLPLSGDDDEYGARFEGDDPRTAHNVFRYAVSPGYFETVGIPLRHGRLLDAHDAAGAQPALVISESLARSTFPDQDPVGKRVHVGPPDRPWFTVVGVVVDVKQASLSVSQTDAVYITPEQWYFTDDTMSLVARTRGDAASLAPSIRSAIRSVDKDQPIMRVATMDSLLAATAAARRFALTLFEAFGLVALVLAGVGIYGVLSGSVAERTHEIGIRIALGAQLRDIFRLVVGQGLRLALVGVAIGLAGAFAVTRLMSSLLFGVSATDPVTFFLVASLLTVVALLASYIPARRASKVDPMVALRYE